jgi:uncharacterized protein YkwD
MPAARPLSRIALLAAGLVLGCGGAGASGGHSASGSPVTRPGQPLTLDEAQRYVLELVNHDRDEHGLAPVTWDDTAAKAGTKHARDMASHGFTAHFGSDGSVPEQRYTEAGGEHMVTENAGCLADGSARELDPDARFQPAELEKIERAFMDEVPPNDGHRRNILTAWHTSVGIGLALTKGLEIPCMAQEFVDRYGAYGALPKSAKVGQKTKIKGERKRPAEVAGVAIARIDFPKPQKALALNQTHGYAIPKPSTTYFPKGFKTPIPLEVDGESFHIEIPLSDGGRPGLYEVSVWAKLPDAKDLVMVSLRTITVAK